MQRNGKWHNKERKRETSYFCAAQHNRKEQEQQKEVSLQRSFCLHCQTKRRRHCRFCVAQLTLLDFHKGAGNRQHLMVGCASSSSSSRRGSRWGNCTKQATSSHTHIHTHSQRKDSLSRDISTFDLVFATYLLYTHRERISVCVCVCVLNVQQ